MASTVVIIDDQSARILETRPDPEPPRGFLTPLPFGAGCKPNNFHLRRTAAPTSSASPSHQAPSVIIFKGDIALRLGKSFKFPARV